MHDGRVIHAAPIDVCDEAARQAFAAAVVEKCPGADGAAVDAELLQFAGDADGGERGPSQATVLVGLAKDAELFHAPGADGETYATVAVGDHRETHRINSRTFRRWLTGLYWTVCSKAPGGQAVQDAIHTLAGQAIHEGAERPVFVRLAEHGGCIYLDLADSQWRVIEVSADGWRTLDNPPVRFIRPRGLMPLPSPTPGGSVDELRDFVNIENDKAWVLLVAWLLAALRPTGPYPVLALSGEQGSAKSMTARLLRCLVDPNTAALRSEPKEPRDLMIAASNGWFVALDNVSYIHPWLSDALCRLATGGGFSTRELYTDGDEKIFDAMRPGILNGIDEVVARADLLDRAVCTTLPAIPEHSRRTEAELFRAFDAARPRILGALLDAVSAALAGVAAVNLPTLPRMADFAVWVTAAEPALGWARGTFLAAYGDNIIGANEAALDGSPVGGVILAFIEASGAWGGTAGELLTALDGRIGEQAARRKEWPKSGRRLAGELRRIAPNLRRAGIAVTFEREADRKRTRIIQLERVGNVSSAPSAPSAPSEDGFFMPESAVAADDSGRCGRNSGRYPDRHRPMENPLDDTENADADDADDADDVFPVCSKHEHTGGNGVPDGWTRDRWVAELRRLAGRCETVNPELAAEHRERAEALAGEG